MADTISLFVNSLGGNAIARAAPIAEAIKEAGYRVEILGFLLGKDKEIYSSYRGEIEPITIQTPRHPNALFPNIHRLARSATGDIIYSFKPLVTTLAPAFYAARLIEYRPLLLDVEDEEVYGEENWSQEASWRRPLRGWRLVCCQA